MPVAEACPVCGHADPGWDGPAKDGWRMWAQIYRRHTHRGSAAREQEARRAGRNLDISHIQEHVGACRWWAHAARDGARCRRDDLLDLLTRTTRYFADPFLLGEFSVTGDLAPLTSILSRQDWFADSACEEKGYSGQLVNLASGQIDIANLDDGAGGAKDQLLPYQEFLSLFFTWLLPLARVNASVRAQAETLTAADRVAGLSSRTIKKIRDSIYKGQGGHAINALLAQSLTSRESAIHLIAAPRASAPDVSVIYDYLDRIHRFARKIEFTAPDDADRLLGLLATFDYCPPPESDPTEDAVEDDRRLRRLPLLYRLDDELSLEAQLPPAPDTLETSGTDASKDHLLDAAAVPLSELDLAEFTDAHHLLHPTSTPMSRAAWHCLLVSRLYPGNGEWTAFVSLHLGCSVHNDEDPPVRCAPDLMGAAPTLRLPYGPTDTADTAIEIVKQALTTRLKASSVDHNGLGEAPP